MEPSSIKPLTRPEVVVTVGVVCEVNVGRRRFTCRTSCSDGTASPS